MTEESSIALLIVEDHPRVRKALHIGLDEAGYECACACSLEEARQALAERTPALVVLDLGLPDGDGITLLEELRRSHPEVRCIILSARDAIEDRLHGLGSGADDYLTKPFVFPELLARVEAQLRRASGEVPAARAGNLAIDRERRTVSVGSEPLACTPKEFELCRILVERQGHTITREQLVDIVWSGVSARTSMDNVVDVHVSRLRNKLREAGADVAIRTQRGVGYRLEGVS